MVQMMHWSSASVIAIMMVVVASELEELGEDKKIAKDVIQADKAVENLLDPNTTTLTKEADKAIDALFNAEKTSFPSCEKCVEYDGKGQCVFIQEGVKKQSICLPYYAREKNCNEPNIVCGSMLCEETNLGKNGKKFHCKLEDKKGAGGIVLLKEEDSCTSCSKYHEPEVADKTPGCLLVNKMKACINPQWYENADEESLCDNALCPKYSKCVADKRDGFFELRCMFDPLMLPKPPHVRIMERTEEIMKKIAIERRIISQYAARLLSLDAKKDEKAAEKVEEEARKSLDTSCPTQNGGDKEKKIQPPTDDTSPFILQERRSARSEPQFTCLLKESLTMDEKCVEHLTTTESKCVKEISPVEEAKGNPGEETADKNKNEITEDTKSKSHKDDETEPLQLERGGKGSSKKEEDVSDMLDQAIGILKTFVYTNTSKEVVTSDEEGKNKKDSQQSQPEEKIEAMKILMDKANDHLHDMITAATTTSDNSNFPKEAVRKVKIMKRLMEEANKALQSHLKTKNLGEDSALVEFLQALSKKGHELLEALGGSVSSQEIPQPQEINRSLKKNNEGSEQDKTVKKKIIPGQTLPDDDGEESLDIESGRDLDPQDCEKYKDANPNLHLLCYILCTQIQQLKQLGTIAEFMGVKVVKDSCPMSKDGECKSSEKEEKVIDNEKSEDEDSQKEETKGSSDKETDTSSEEGGGKGSSEDSEDKVPAPISDAV